MVPKPLFGNILCLTYKIPKMLAVPLEEERLRKEEWQREEDRQKAREKRERAERNAKVMAEIDRNMNRGR